MAEFESLATEEPLAAHLARHAYDRLLMLSDGIFAIATTLAALEIRLPEGIRDPYAAFVAMQRPLTVYALSFLVIGIFWASHRNLFARVRQVDRMLTVLTLAMLFAVSLIPVGVGGIAESGANAGFVVYIATMGACSVLNAAMWSYAAFRPGVMRDDVTREDRLLRGIGSFAMPLLLLPMLIVPVDRFVTVVVPTAAVILIVRRRLLPWLIRRKFTADSGGQTVAERRRATQ